MDRLTTLQFEADLRYEETASGILIPVRLTYGDGAWS